jgi:hypothetical protein
MHLGFQTMRTELKRVDALLAKGNIPKPETSDRREDYDRDRDRDRGSYRPGGRGGYRGTSYASPSGGYRSRGRGFRHGI